jgi:ketosteroid isomerase-like protein
MKSIIAFATATMLSLAVSAIAQEESPSPATEEKASATVEETPAPAATARPTTTTTESPAAAKKEATTAAKKEATTTAAPKKAGSPMAAASPAKKMSVEAALKDNENKWEASVASHDASVAQSVIASDFTGVYWDGKVMSKSWLMGEMKKDKDTYKSAVNDKLAVHSYGPTVAVVVGTAHEKGTGKDGKAFDRLYRFTDTWVERNGQWQCVASHLMKVRG